MLSQILVNFGAIYYFNLLVFLDNATWRFFKHRLIYSFFRASTLFTRVAQVFPRRRCERFWPSSLRCRIPSRSSFSAFSCSSVVAVALPLLLSTTTWLLPRSSSPSTVSFVYVTSDYFTTALWKLTSSTGGTRQEGADQQKATEGAQESR